METMSEPCHVEVLGKKFERNGVGGGKMGSVFQARIWKSQKKNSDGRVDENVVNDSLFPRIEGEKRLSITGGPSWDGLRADNRANCGGEKTIPNWRGECRERTL